MPLEVSDATRSRVTGALSWLTRRKERQSPHVRRLMMAVALALFVGTTAWAIRALDGVPLADGWPAWFAVAAGLSLGAYVINAVEFAVSAKLLGARPTAVDSLRVSLLGSAANILPIPGAALIRAGALQRMGLGIRSSLSVTAIVGLAWVATGGLVAGALLVPADAVAVGSLCLLGGVGAYVVAFALLVAQLKLRPALRALPLVAAVELASVALGMVRTWVVLQGIGSDASIAQASALAVAAIVSSAAGLFPGGLGLREALSMAVAAAIGIPAAVGGFAAAADRVVGYLTLAASTAVMLAVAGRPPAAGTDPDPDTQPRSDKVPR